MQSAQKMVNEQERAEAQTLAIAEHAAVILFLACLALIGFALPYL